MEAREVAVETEAGAAAGVAPRRGTQVRLLEQVEPGLPSRYYTSPDVYEQEKARIFATRWLCAGREDDVAEPGSYVLREVAGESVIVVRDQAGTIRAFHNVCRHRGSVLCEAPEGRFPRHGIVCPYHAWTYGLDGRLQGTPHMVRVPDFARQEFPLYPAAVARWEGFIFLSLAERPEPLTAAMGGLHDHFARYGMGRLRRGARRVYEVAANWKLVVENFTECYHCPAIHPELNRVTPYLGGGKAEKEGEADWRGGAWMDLIPEAATLTVSGQRRRPNLAGLRAEDAGRVYYNVLYPGLFLSLHPDYVLTHTLWPDGPGRTRVVCEWLFDPGTMAGPDFDPGDAVEFWDLVNRQDWKACELTQRGNASRAHAAGVLVGQEAGPRHVARWVLQHLASQEGSDPK